MSIYILLAIGLILVILLVSLVVWIIVKHTSQSGKRNPITDELENLTNKLADFVNLNQVRLEKIRPFIASYFNTLYEDGNTASIISKILYTLEYRIRNAELAIKKGSHVDQKAALEELTSPISIDLNKKFNTSGEESDSEEKPEEYTIAFNELEEVVENLFQSIGQRIAGASKSMSSYRGERKKRKDTIAILIEAGIKNIGE